MIFAETERLFLRRLTREELPRLVEQIGAWDIARQLVTLPFPYFMKDAEEFYHDIKPSYDNGEPHYLALALKSDNLLIGGVGLHPPRIKDAFPGEIEIGYWLAKDHWGKGLMSEAAQEAVKLAFARPSVAMVGAVTSTSNKPSQQILQKIGLKNMGERKRDYPVLRGDDIILRWLMTRDEWRLAS